jgi:transposase-like protein
VVKQAELGLPVAELIRQVGISEQTFYRWKKELRRAGAGAGARVQAARR